VDEAVPSAEPASVVAVAATARLTSAAALGAATPVLRAPAGHTVLAPRRVARNASGAGTGTGRAADAGSGVPGVGPGADAGEGPDVPGLGRRGRSAAPARRTASGAAGRRHAAEAPLDVPVREDRPLEVLGGAGHLEPAGPRASAPVRTGAGGLADLVAWFDPEAPAGAAAPAASRSSAAPPPPPPASGVRAEDPLAARASVRELLEQVLLEEARASGLEVRP
jgi:hypothetical protein